MIRSYHGISLRRLFYVSAEIIQLSATYLGIAVLVAGTLAFSVPFVRDQVSNAHRVWVEAVGPEGFRQAASFDGLDAASEDMDNPLSMVAPLMAADEVTRVNDAVTAEQAKLSDGTPGPHLNFTRALVDSEEQAHIPGVTAAQAQSLRRYISRKYRIAGNVTGALIRTVFAVGRDMGLEPQLLLAVIAIESRYNPYAESHVGAQGLMQVMTKVHKEKFAAFGEGPIAAVHPLANIQVGAQILSDCIKRRGSLEGGLACYVGATGPGDGGYGAKVKAERSRLALASGIPIWRDGKF